jgi:hypothetical protein
MAAVARGQASRLGIVEDLWRCTVIIASGAWNSKLSFSFSTVNSQGKLPRVKSLRNIYLGKILGKKSLGKIPWGKFPGKHFLGNIPCGKLEYP